MLALLFGFCYILDYILVSATVPIFMYRGINFNYKNVPALVSS